MSTKGLKPIVVLSAVIGAIAGFAVLHPYAMMVYALHACKDAIVQNIFQAAAGSFEPDMLWMGLPFALFGAFTGLLFGLWSENRKKRADLEKQLARWISKEAI